MSETSTHSRCRIRRAGSRAALLAGCVSFITLCLLTVGCSSATGSANGPSTSVSASSPPARSPSAPAARPRIVILGDSLAAGRGLEPGEAFPARLQERLDNASYAYEVVAAGVSGDTSAGGLRRLDWSLADDVEILVVELGGNDGLRGLPVEQLEHNLDAIVRRTRERGIQVLIAGMEAPPNLGSGYTTAFRAAFRQVARKHGVDLLPFVLEGVAGESELNQSDGIHPNAAGADRVAENIWRALKPLLTGPTAQRAEADS